MTNPAGMLRMQVEIKVAQNFVLNFLFNKLPRRRVNLFGEELESALVEKFQDHWYPEMPFKGSAFRCLRVTDPNDPVLNRAARESGNPISDIIENLPADLAIWIDPGEVSYRIGEKGSVKILYSEGDHSDWNGGMSPVGGCSSSNQLQSSNSTTSSGASDDLNAEVAGFMPIESLNSALNSMAVSQPQPKAILPQAVLPTPPAPSNLGLTPLLPAQQPTMSGSSCNGNVIGGLSATGSGSGFNPFPPRPHQPHQQQQVIYTAGTFAQTKFGSTKLKTNGKKTNRMSPTEFSNYIKQRALQKQNSVNGQYSGGGRNGHCNNMSNTNINGFRPLPRSLSHNYNGYPNCGSNGMPQISNQNGCNSNNYQLSKNNSNSDPFFYPVVQEPQRNGFGSSNSSSNSGFHNNGLNSMSNLNATNMTLNRSSNPWSSCVDADTEAFLQDILTVGLQQSTKQQRLHNNGGSGSNSSDFGSASSSSSSSSDFGPNGLASGLFADRFGTVSTDHGLNAGENSSANKISSFIGEPHVSGRNPSGNNGNEKCQQRALVAN